MDWSTRTIPSSSFSKRDEVSTIFSKRTWPTIRDYYLQDKNGNYITDKYGNKIIVFSTPYPKDSNWTTRIIPT